MLAEDRMFNHAKETSAALTGSPNSKTVTMRTSWLAEKRHLSSRGSMLTSACFAYSNWLTQISCESCNWLIGIINFSACVHVLPVPEFRSEISTKKLSWQNSNTWYWVVQKVFFFFWRLEPCYPPKSQKDSVLPGYRTKTKIWGLVYLLAGTDDFRTILCRIICCLLNRSTLSSWDNIKPQSGLAKS